MGLSKKLKNGNKHENPSYFGAMARGQKILIDKSSSIYKINISLKYINEVNEHNMFCSIVELFLQIRWNNFLKTYTQTRATPKKKKEITDQQQRKNEYAVEASGSWTVPMVSFILAITLWLQYQSRPEVAWETTHAMYKIVLPHSQPV